ncbi:NAD(P)-dependent oxidoreductase [Microbacterium sp. NPDC077663]|uniref:NAD(P)-dependent oxidoreductase n=1 Tax=Microbacterium sp. NPDC077663 TaxID=3364189 RepID=UPI0037CACC59
MTDITVIGGTGYAGAAIVKEAVTRGHRVTSLSRSLPADRIDGATYVQGDARDAADAIAGAQVVVGALSPRAGTEGTLVATYTAIAEQAAAAGARLLIIGGFGSLRPAPGAPRFAEGDQMPPEVIVEAREVNSVLTALESGAPVSLDWVFISPAAVFGGYTPQGDPHGTYRTSTGIALFDEQGNSAIEGADFALAVVDEIEKAEHHRSQLNFAY